jgi:hypothetical protein
LFGVDVEAEDVDVCGDDLFDDFGSFDLDGAMLKARELVRLKEAVDVFLYRSTNSEPVPRKACDLHSSAAVNRSVSPDAICHTTSHWTH